MKKINRYIAGVLSLLILTLLIPQSVYASSDSSLLLSELDKISESGNENKSPVMIAHRGMSSLAPENTVLAIKMAGLYGYQGVEFDLQETKDGKFVISHDDTVTRMTSGSGKIKELTLSQIKKLTIDNGNGIERYSGLKIATLEEALTCCKEYNLVPVIDVKNLTEVKNFLKIIKKYGYMDSITITSQKVSILKVIRKKNRNVNLTLTSSEDGITAINKAISLKCDGISLEHNRLNDKVIAYAKEKGMTLSAWTVNTLSVKNKCKKYGVDYIITNIMADSNTFDNLSVEENYEVTGKTDANNVDSPIMKVADSIESCINNENTWFEVNNVTTVNIGKDMSYYLELIDDDVEKGNIITITAEVNSLSGYHPYFSLYENGILNDKTEDSNQTTGWHTVRYVYTANSSSHMQVRLGLNEGEPGLFRIKNIQVSKLSRYQPENLTMTQALLELSVGSIYNLSENMQFTDKRTIIKWKSSKEKIASITELGCITAKKVGKAVIKVESENGKTTECIVIVKPKRMTGLKTAKKASKSITLSWTRDKAASGYEIYCQEEGQESYHLVKSISNNAKTGVTIKNLKTGQKYNYKIRAYIKIDSEKYYGNFSNIKSVKPN